ncbi:MAG: polyphenol oxidase family protein [Planctomycetes bacterium]|nr:polyphenol oxidase family protein [Planctomycetota bacterium]
MDILWTKCGGPIPLLVAEAARREGFLVAASLGEDGAKPDLGCDAADRAACPDDRRRLAEAVGLDAEHLVFMEQVHGGAVAVVDERQAGAGLHDRRAAVAGADSMVTCSSAVALVALSADCPLVAAWDAEARLAAVAHAGWRGLAAEVLRRMVERMVDLGADTRRIGAAVGPAIGACCYEVGPDLVDALVGSGIALPEHLRPVGSHLHMDLGAVVERQLCQAGVAAERISVEPTCTMCCEPLLHSYRRDGSQAGRQALVIRREER